jgi:hypothetical protein
VARAGATPTLPRARKKKRTTKKPDDASPWVASAEGTSPERGGDSKNAARSRPRTSLGDGVVKSGGGRIAWAQLLRRVYLVDVLACPCGGRRAMVSDISERAVVVALLAHLGLPPDVLTVFSRKRKKRTAKVVAFRRANIRKSSSDGRCGIPDRGPVT